MQSVGLMCRFVSLNANYRRGDMSRGNGTVEVRMGENQIGRPGAVLTAMVAMMAGMYVSELLWSA